MIYDILTPFSLRGVEARNGSAYVEKMMHAVPDATVVDRLQFILAHCKGKRVLNLGCASGTLHEQIRAVAIRIDGIDKVHPCDLIMDLDQPTFISPTGALLNYFGSFDVIVAGEIFEHLTNPGNALRWIKNFDAPLLLTVPNAFSDPAQHWIRREFEQVNSDHVAWYSWQTMSTLLKKTGFEIQKFHWYNGKPLTAEGLIFLTK